MKLLVTGAWRASREELDALEAMGYSVLWMQDERGALPADVSGVEGVICNGLFLYHPIDRFPGLKYIQLTSAGMDRVPLEEIRRRGIEIHNARGVYSVPMAEFALSGVLQLYKQSRFFWKNQTEKRWEKHRGLLELADKTVCIVGCGSVGTECARRFAAFGCRVVGCKRQPENRPFFERVYPLEALEELLPAADVLVLAVPLTAGTRHLMNRERLAQMKPGAVLVNLARGALVDTEGLVIALENGLGGAVLDVFEEEPLSPESPLWELEQVILTPHNSFVGEGNSRRLYRVIIENLEQMK